MKILFLAAAALLATSCAPPPPEHPALSPMTATELLRFDSRAQNWISYARAQDPSCDFKLDFPMDMAHRDSIEVDHIVTCSGNNRMRAFDTNVEFSYDHAKQRWVISHFGG